MGRQTANHNNTTTIHMINTLEQFGSTEIQPVIAEHGASTVSNKYGFFSTQSLLESLEGVGFVPRSIRAARTTKKERQGFQRHVVRLQHKDLLPMQVNEYKPEILLTNAHDATCSLRLTLGIYRLVCSNGLVVGDTLFTERFIHRNINVEAVNEAAVRLTSMIPQLNDKVERMRSHRMDYPEITKFINEAAKLRFEDEQKAKAAAASLGNSRRYEDGHNNMWSVFNRVQENLIRGAFGMRAITSAARDVYINRKLWNLAESHMNN
jgi:hypothetical protein